MNTLPFYEICNRENMLSFDGDKTNLRLDVKGSFYNHWGADNKADYDKACADIDAIQFSGNGWKLYAWYDISSFTYWMKDQREQNYLQITVSFDSDTIDESEVYKINDAVIDAESMARAICEQYDYNPQSAY